MLPAIFAPFYYRPHYRLIFPPKFHGHTPPHTHNHNHKFLIFLALAPATAEILASGQEARTIP
jgi:hypothetical protein